MKRQHSQRRRIGIGWPVTIPTTTNHLPVSLEGRNISVELRNPAEQVVPVKFTIEANLIKFYFSANSQKYLGRYSITVWENRGKDNQNAFDIDYFVELVPSSEMADEPCCDNMTLPCGNFCQGNAGVVVVNEPMIFADGDENESYRTVTIEHDELTTPGADIYFTTNGADPKTEGVLYEEPFVVNTNTVVKAAALLNDRWSDEVAEENVNVTVREIEDEREWQAPVVSASYSNISANGGASSPTGVSFTQQVIRHYTDGSSVTDQATTEEKAQAQITFSLSNQLEGADINAEGKVTYNTASASKIDRKVGDVTVIISNQGVQGTKTIELKQTKASMSLSLTSMSNISYNGANKTSVITKTDGVIISSVQSSDESVATASLDGDTITVTIKKSEVNAVRNCTISINDNVGFNLSISVSQAAAPLQMYYGKMALEKNFADITQADIDAAVAAGNLTKANASKLGKTQLAPEVGECSVVLIAAASSLVATKDNGFGQKVPFEESYRGANGVLCADNKFKAYGELSLSSGDFFIYVD